VRLPLLHRLAAGDGTACACEDVDAAEVAARGELVESSCKEVVPARARRILAVLAPGGRATAAKLGAVDQVVVDKGRHVHELNRYRSGERALAIGRRQVHEERAQTLAARCDGAPPDRFHEPRVSSDRRVEPLFQLVQIRAGFLQDGLGAHWPP
jgi:hypothetical protein